MSTTTPPFPAASAILSSYLTQLRLPTMAASCAAVAREAAASNLDYLAFLTLLCGQEVAQREQTQAARRLAQAQFPWPKTLDEFDFSAAPAVPQAAVLQLTTGAFVRAQENWLVLGGPGVGKTHLLCGVGRALCQRGFRVRFRTAAALVNELLLADQAHRLPRLLKQWCSIDLFIVDEVGYIPFSTVGAQLLFQFFADRHEVASVAISTNLEFARFTEVFHDERMTAALLDRLTFKSTVMVIEGESYRLKASLRRQAPAPAPRSLSARRAAWLLIRRPADLEPDEQVVLDQLTATCRAAAVAYELAQAFTDMVRERNEAALDGWFAAVEASGLADLRSFAVGLRRDEAAVRAGLSLPWSQGQVEGQVNRLKLIKREGYGRANFDLLRHRVLAA